MSSIAVTVADAVTKIGDLFGPVAAREALSASDSHAAALVAYADMLVAADAAEYLLVASYAIWDSANSSRFRIPFYDVECKATMCFAESQRRHVAAGHASDCRGATLYGQAWNAAVRDAGHSSAARPQPACTCGHDEAVQTS